MHGDLRVGIYFARSFCDAESSESKHSKCMEYADGQAGIKLYPRSIVSKYFLLEAIVTSYPGSVSFNVARLKNTATQKG